MVKIKIDKKKFINDLYFFYRYFSLKLMFFSEIFKTRCGVIKKSIKHGNFKNNINFIIINKTLWNQISLYFALEYFAKKTFVLNLTLVI